MENKNFDHIIKSKLEKLESISPPNDWDQFEKILENVEQDQASDDQFDERIAQKTKDFHVNYDESHWHILKDRLERQELFLTSIYFSKIVEAATIFLIIFTFFNVYQGTTTDPSSYHIAQNEIDMDLNGINDESSPIEIAQITDIKPHQNAPATSINLLRETRTPSRREIGHVLNISTSVLPIQTLNSKVVITHSPILDVEPIQSTELSYLFKSDEPGKEMVNINTLPTDIQLLQNTGNELLLTITPVTNPGEFSFLAFHISPTVNIVNSPIDYINKIDAYSTEALGVEMGIGYGYRKNHLAMSTGIIYARKSYQPKIIDETTGSFFTSYDQTSLRNIRFDMISIPLGLQYYFADAHKKWNFYTSAGISFNLVALADYEVKKNGQIIEDPERFFATLRSSSSVLAHKDFSNGVFEGGDVLENLFMTLDLGFGVERKLSTQSYLYFSPTLRQHIGLAGIGPNSDKVHSLGFIMGMRIKM